MNMPAYSEKDGVYRSVARLVLHFADGGRKELDYRKVKKLAAVSVEEYRIENSDFIDLIFKHHKDVKTVDELSALCGYNSTKTFTRHFVKAFHTTPKQWLMSLKRSEVLFHIKHTNTPLTDIAALLGFSSISHLNHFCNNQIGQNPSDIRLAALTE